MSEVETFVYKNKDLIKEALLKFCQNEEQITALEAENKELKEDACNKIPLSVLKQIDKLEAENEVLREQNIAMCNTIKELNGKLEKGAEVNERLKEIILKANLWHKAPCCLCGYNGKGYYQPGTHICAKQAKALSASKRQRRRKENDMETVYKCKECGGKIHIKDMGRTKDGIPKFEMWCPNCDPKPIKESK